MPSNRVVTYINIKLNSVDDYWNELITPNVKAFHSEASPRTIFNAAHAIWHLHDWVWHERNPGQDTRNNPAFTAYRDRLLTVCPQLGWLRDIADAGKHRGLSRSDLTSDGLFSLRMKKQTGFFVVVAWDEATQDVDTLVGVDEVIRNAIEFWQTELNSKSLPSPFDQA